MKTLIMTKFLAFLIIFICIGAEASISDDLKKDIPTSYYIADINQTSPDQVIKVNGAVVKSALYSKPIYLEIEIEDRSYDKEIYIVNRSNENQKNNRKTKAEFISDVQKSTSWMKYDGNHSGNAEVLYVGRGENNTSRFLIFSPGISSNTYITIYVKMNGVQYSNLIHVNGGF